MKDSQDAIVIDVGTGNLHSVLNALQSQGFKVKLSSDPDEVLKASRLILPGVGAFGRFMEGFKTTQPDHGFTRGAQTGDTLAGHLCRHAGFAGCGKRDGRICRTGIHSGRSHSFSG